MGCFLFDICRRYLWALRCIALGVDLSTQALDGSRVLFDLMVTHDPAGLETLRAEAKPLDKTMNNK